MKRAVCLYTDNLQPSGLGEHMLALAAGLRESYALSFVCPPSPAGLSVMARARAMGIETFGIELPAERAGPEKLRGWLRARRVEVFHTHAGNLWEGHDGSVPAARAAGVPAVVRTEHLPDLTGAPWFDDAPWKHTDYEGQIGMVDRVICVSEEARASFVRRNVPARKFRVVRNGIEPRPARSDRSGVRERLGVPPRARVVLTVAKLTVRKGYRTLLEAVPAVARREPDAYFLWVGEGALEHELLRRVRALGLEEKVRLTGQRDDVPDLMAASDLFVLPSLAEALPLVVLEAMAAGLTVVGTRVCGTSEAVRDGVTGRLVAAGEADPLAAAVLQALKSPRLAARWGAAGKSLFRREFGAGRMTRETAEIYEELLRDRTGACDVPVRGGASEQRGSGVRSGDPERMKVQRTRVGVIGAGYIGEKHLDSLLGFDDVLVAAVADRRRDRAREQAARCGANAYEDHERMLDAEELDALYICVPPFAHGAPEMAAVERGLPFFVEKPLALDGETAEGIARSVRDRGLVTAVGYHWRYLNVVEKAWEVLNGNPARLALGYWLDETPPVGWWARKDRSGGQMVEQTTHVFDLARLLVGEVSRVYATGARTARPAFPDADVSDVSVATLHFNSGALGTVSSTCLLRSPHRVGLHLFCEGLAVEVSRSELVVDDGEDRRVYERRGDPIAREDRDFLDAVRGRENRIRAPYAEALRTHRLAVAAARSAREGRVLELRPEAADPAVGRHIPNRAPTHR